MIRRLSVLCAQIRGPDAPERRLSSSAPGSASASAAAAAATAAATVEESVSVAGDDALEIDGLQGHRVRHRHALGDVVRLLERQEVHQPEGAPEQPPEAQRVSILFYKNNIIRLI